MNDVIIFGGGWTGIIFAFEFKRVFPGLGVTVFERTDLSGGLLRSSVINGHVFDVGGSHIIFSSNRDMLDRMLSLLDENFVKHLRRTYVWLGFAFVPYPLENGLFVLPPEERAEALISFLDAWVSRDRDWTPRTFNDWIYSFFGRYIAEKYLVPYNMKIWKRPLESIDVDWVYTQGRLPIPDWRNVVKSAAGVPTVGYLEQSSFYYPRYGGIQSLFDSASKEAENLGVKIINNVRVSKVKRADGEWIVNDEFKAEKIISTIPLNELVKAMDAPNDVAEAARKLDYNRVLVVGAALKKPAPDQHWVYVPDQNIAFHRYAWISNYSPENAPKGRSTLLAEVTLPPKVKVDVEELKDKVLVGLESLNIINKRGDVLFTKAWLHEYGYPIHSPENRERREKILRWLKEQNIISIGRWGSWQYWNMDRVYKEVLTALESNRWINC